MKRTTDIAGWEKRGFILVFLLFIVYYGYRLAALTPWYDELYTYYFFISRGPVYAAIHWPVPNNHVGYSVLSGFLELISPGMIGLRGVSFVCALANLLLIYRFGSRHLRPGWSLGAVCLYGSMNLVNQLAVQGRGYTLAVTCCLTALMMLEAICLGEKALKRHYIVFALALTLGLYTVPSSVYWVLPLCLAGGIYLVLPDSRDMAKLVKLIISALAAAVMTVGLYTVIWLAIGSNLLVKGAESAFYGWSHFKTITAAPGAAIRTGIDYMLATPYIQSVAGDGFAAKLFQWLLVLLNELQGGARVVMLLIVLGGSLLLLRDCFRKERREKRFFQLCLLSGIWLPLLMLLIQHSLPYYRVFSFMGVFYTFSGIYLLEKGEALITGWLGRRHTAEGGPEAGDSAAGYPEADRVHQLSLGAVMVVFAILAGARLLSPSYTAQLGEREAALADAFAHSDFAAAVRPCVTDCTQQYLIRYLYGAVCENQDISGSDYLMLDKKMADPDYDNFEWEFYHTYDTIPWDYVSENMEKVYENEMFLVYRNQNQLQ